jgi:hypothetical protein
MTVGLFLKCGRRIINMTTIIKGYYIPYSAKAVHILRKAQQRLNAQWSVDSDECVTVIVPINKIQQLERMLSPIV